MFRILWNSLVNFFMGTSRKSGFPDLDIDWEKIEDDCSAQEMPFVEELQPKKKKKKSSANSKKKSKKKASKHK